MYYVCVHDDSGFELGELYGTIDGHWLDKYLLAGTESRLGRINQSSPATKHLHS